MAFASKVNFGFPRGRLAPRRVVCHPHPKHGGSKDHPILWALRNELAGVRDVAVLGFNFRGVMGSGGVYGGGHDEINDVRPRSPGPRVGARCAQRCSSGGRSAPTWRCAPPSTNRRSASLVMIGVPLRPKDLALPPLPDTSALLPFRRPTLVVCGDNDEYCPVEDARDVRPTVPRRSSRGAGREPTTSCGGTRSRPPRIVGGFVDDSPRPRRVIALTAQRARVAVRSRVDRWAAGEGARSRRTAAPGTCRRTARATTNTPAITKTTPSDSHTNGFCHHGRPSHRPPLHTRRNAPIMQSATRNGSATKTMRWSTIDYRPRSSSLRLRAGPP